MVKNIKGKIKGYRREIKFFGKEMEFKIVKSARKK
jgi:hypothetical protein